MDKHNFKIVVNSNIVQILNFYFIIDNIVRYALVERKKERESCNRDYVMTIALMSEKCV